MEKKRFMVWFIIVIAAFLLYAKSSLLKNDPCEDNCQSITSEAKLLLCLDSCAVNANEIINSYSPSKVKVFLILFVVFSMAVFLIGTIQHFYIDNDKNEKCKVIEDEEEERINKIDNYYSKLDN